MFRLDNISKRFGDIVALDGVSVEFLAGKVHGVLGENGAGKTTLMRIAAGLCGADSGAISIAGNSLDLSSPLAAAQAGIAMVHQHFMLVPTLTVAENCVLGRRDLGQWIDRRKIGEQLEVLARRTGLEVDPHARIESLSVGQQQRAEILRALNSATKILILDEPTAVLTPRETDQLFRALERLREQGLAIVFISHKLDEVQQICDELTILRRGKVVYQGSASHLSKPQMAEHMVGASISSLPQRRPPEPQAHAVLEVIGLCAVHPDSHRQISSADLTVHAGEIVGVAGVEGNGQDVLAGAVLGVYRATRGRIIFDGRDVTRTAVRPRFAAGMAHIAEDRLSESLVPMMGLDENLLLKRFRSPDFARYGLINWKVAREYAALQLKRFDVRSRFLDQPAGTLSGGNQQKLVLARELSGSPRLIVAQNPVRGLDVAATRFVFDQLLAQCDRGAGVLLIHSDLDELLSVSDRVAVLYNGRLTWSDWPHCTRERIGQLMLGEAT